MSNSRFIVVDSDPVAANELCRALSEFGYAFPVARIDEIGTRGIGDFSIFVSDRDGQLNDVIEYVRERGIFYPILPYSSDPSPQRVVETIRCGALSYVTWPCSNAWLASILCAHEESCKILFRENATREMAFKLLKTLTRRETDVLGEMATGAPSKEISEKLGISYRTVEVHRSSILSKLKVRNAVGAVRLALEMKLPTVPASYR